MSLGFGFSLPALVPYGAGGNNPFGQLGPTLDLSFAGTATDTNNPNGYTLNTNFIVPQYQISEPYTVWETNVGLVSKTFSQIITFTRASSATYFDSAGVLQTATTNTPRFDYNPSTLAAQGFLIEEARTNSIRNNTMQGAVAGTPGTAPTNWVISTATGNLTSREIVGIGTENGITYIDVRFVASGVVSAASVYADSSTGVAALNGQTWTSAFYVKLAGGSLTNVTVRTTIVENDSGGNFLAGTDSSAFVPTTGALATQRFAQTRTNTNASTAFVWSRVKVEFSGAGDVTLRIGLPQLEQGAFATSVIPTTTAAVTRAADVASVNTLSPWFNAAAGTLYVEGVTNRPYAAATGGQMAQLSDGTANNRMWIAQGNTTANTSTNSVVSTGGAPVADINYGPVPSASYLNKSAFAYATNDFAGCAGGGTVATDTLGAVPTVTTFYLGISASLSAASTWNGYLRRVVYYPRRLSNAELQAITA